MKLNISKNGLISIAIIAILITPIASMAIPSAEAATYTSYPFLGAVPNPVGVGQQVLLHVGALTALQTASDGWVGLTIHITKPDNTTTVINAPKTDSTGGTGTIFVPDVVGTYYMYTNFPEQDFRNNTYLEAKSDVLELVVQADPIEYYPSVPLPTEYWSRPIDSQLREWHSIAGSWLMTPRNLYVPYNDGPRTPHILWQMPIGETMGGLVGGEYGENSYGIGDAYEGKWAGSIIISGVLYYHEDESGSPNQTIVAVDLHTGEVLWKKTLFDNRRITFGQIIDWDCLNYHGAFSYLWVVSGTNWWAFDAKTGDWRFNITGVPTGTNYFGSSGEVLKYSIVNYGTTTNPNRYLLQWNQSWVITQGKTGMAESWGSQVKGVSYNATTRPGYDLNVSIPSMQGTSNPSILTVFPEDRVIGGSANTDRVHLWGISLEKGREGTVLFNNTWTAPQSWRDGNVTVSGFQAGWAAFSSQDKLAVLFAKETRVHYGFSLETGDFLWETEPAGYLDAWDDALTVTFGPSRAIVNGIVYTASISGVVYAFDAKTGQTIWTYDAVDTYSEFQFANSWWLRIMFVTDDLIYVGHLEHSPVDPRPRGAPFIALDAQTGELVFRSDGLFRQSRWGGRAIMGDSIIATQDTYNQQVYGIGKGPSKTTITAPNIGVPLGTSVIISGTVTDVSPGTGDYTIKARFPNGVPAVSDASQGEWMGHVYKQFARPTNAQGVNVTLSVIDANGNFRDIGITTTDSSGQYSVQWTPDISGKYTVIATFPGSEAYYASFDQTAIGVDDIHEATHTPTPSPVTAADMYLLPGIIAIIVAIIIVGIVLALLVMKKRP